MVLGNTLNILRPPGVATTPIQTGWNEDLVKNMHKVLGELAQQITARTFGGFPEGTSRPALVTANGFWLNITTATAPVLTMFDGTDDIPVLTFDYAANTVSFAGLASFDLVDDTSPQLGGDLDLNGNVITGLEIGTDIQALDATLTSIAGVAGVEGDILHATGTDIWARLAKGSDDEVLTLVSGLPAWASLDAGPTLVVKPSDETVNDSSSLQDDDALVFAMEANTTYAVDVILLKNAANTTADWKIKWDVPTGCTMIWGPPDSSSWGTSGTPAVFNTESTVDVQGSVSGDHGNLYTMVVFNGANAGNLQLTWAQDTPNATNNKILKHSHMIIRSLGAT